MTGRRDVRGALRRAAARLGGREAAIALAHALGVERPRLYADPGRPLSAAEARRLGRWVARRRRGEPAAYLAGEVAFWDMRLAVGPGVLVPRPETEVLVEVALELLSRLGPEPVVVDLGSGSGAVGLAVARAAPHARVWLTEVSPRALAYARANARRWAPQVGLLLGDGVAPLVRTGVRPDLVLMNPPYLDRRSLARVAREVRREPRRALDGGRDGLSFYRRLAREVPPVLRPGGYLAVEVGAGQAPRVHAILMAAGGQSLGVRPDLSGIPRVVWGQWSSPR